MKISYLWLKDYIKSETNINDLVEILTNTGLEVSSVEKVEFIKGGLEGLVVGEVTNVEKHPNADRLSLTTVEVGNGLSRRIVCGAPNVAVGQKVVVALPGTTLFPIGKEAIVIKSGKIRGEVSDGMICAEDEIGLGNSHDGIMVLKKSAMPGTLFKDYMNLKEDYSIEIDLTPNRTDAISHFGVARDYLAAKNLQPGFTLEKISLPDVKNFVVDNHDLEIIVKVTDRDACPRYSGVTMTNVEVGPSPEWLASRLKTIGVKPINNIVDAANYVMFETGQPLHVFDADEISGNIVVVRKEKEGSKFTTLDGIERVLSADDLMISCTSGPMCMAGIFGGLTSGVKDTTKQIFIESAYFRPTGIRKSAKRHGLSTDASYRYERGANPDVTIYALKRLANLIKNMSDAKVSSEIVDEYPLKIEQAEVSLAWKYLHKVAGTELGKSEVRGILTSLHIEIMMEDLESLKLRIPGYRTDVNRDIDVVEEILRIYGYNNIPLPEKMLTSFSHSQFEDGSQKKRDISAYLSANGFREILNNSLSSPELWSEGEKMIRVLNPLSNELAVLRPSLTEGGLETILYNLNRNVEDLRLFEFGKVYTKKSQSEFEEVEHLAIWLTGSVKAESWREKAKKIDFFDCAEILYSLLSRFGLDRSYVTCEESTDKGFQFGLRAIVGKKVVADFGKISSERLKHFDIRQSVFMVDIYWKELLSIGRDRMIKFSPIPRFPSVRRDLALLINDEVAYSELESAARECEKKILTHVNLFDIYKGKGIESGKKSYAMSFLFRDNEKTLTDKQVDQVMEKLIKKFQKDFSAEIR